VKNKEVNPVVLVVVGVVLVALCVGAWMSMNPNPQKVDLTKVTKEDIEDRDPPKPGQPGYRERITDPVSK